MRATRCSLKYPIGPRLLTLILYLSDVDGGGETAFPRVRNFTFHLYNKPPSRIYNIHFPWVSSNIDSPHATCAAQLDGYAEERASPLVALRHGIKPEDVGLANDARGQASFFRYEVRSQFVVAHVRLQEPSCTRVCSVSLYHSSILDPPTADGRSSSLDSWRRLHLFVARSQIGFVSSVPSMFAVVPASTCSPCMGLSRNTQQFRQKNTLGRQT